MVAGGRVFTLSSNELENLGPSREQPHYLAAHDAWNGLPLWKLNCESTDDGAFLTYENAGPLAADADHVYAVKDGKVVGVDAATGQVVVTCSTKHPAVRLLLLDGVLLYSRRLGIHRSHCTSSTPLRAQQCVGCSPHAHG